MPRRSAARVKCPSSATTTKYLRWRSSISISSRRALLSILDVSAVGKHTVVVLHRCGKKDHGNDGGGLLRPRDYKNSFSDVVDERTHRWRVRRKHDSHGVA